MCCMLNKSTDFLGLCVFFFSAAFSFASLRFALICSRSSVLLVSMNETGQVSGGGYSYEKPSMGNSFSGKLIRGNSSDENDYYFNWTGFDVL